VIVNDGSSPESKVSKCIDTYQKKDKRIRLINNVKNLGVPMSLNIGFDAARQEKADYIARMDADDISI